VRAPCHLLVVWRFIPLLRPLALVISCVIRLDVINAGYTIFSLFIALYVKFDPDTHKGVHSVLALKLGVTKVVSEPY
jgi:hypothetical protein